MSDLFKFLSDYFIYFAKTLDFWKSVQEITPSSLRPLVNQSEQLRLCSRTQLDEQFLLKFPYIREKLLGKIEIGIEEEMSSIIKIEEEMKTYVDALKVRLNSVEKFYMKFDHEEPKDFNPLIPSSDKLVELALDGWRCFHILWAGVKTSIETVDYYSKDSVNDISEALFKYKQLEAQLNYILEITQYLRT